MSMGLSIAVVRKWLDHEVLKAHDNSNLFLQTVKEESIYSPLIRNLISIPRHQ